MGAVIVGYVATAEGEAALDRAVLEARLRDAQLIVVSSHRGGSDFDGDDSRRVDAQVEAVRERLSKEGIDFDVRTMVRGFEPAEDLISLAEASGAELIVIGLRRRSPVGKLLLGSNSQRILLDAPCAVLAVKA
ncbi:universal stress protein [Nocardioides daphniae]|uniref:Universal stress protein n=1 Tax=Nocardioides daphniae TaxID=402297 RepID=A0A4P7UAG5_9ACTN|nr:universal stress protein [Nocardioides daphniae]QCC77073.1 universal stress protein [Nocardioides daphniae]GGD19312.1 universal stress protein UspA [Nocardioides daphniae]